MNAIDLLKQDHEKVKQLFTEYDTADDRRREIAENIFRELEAHTRVEEDIFYPAVRKNSDKDGKELVKHSLEEHKEVDDLISQLRAMDVSDPDFDDMFQEMMEDVEHHIDQEEAQLFPKAQALGKQLDDLAQQIMEEKEVVMGR